MKLMIFAIFAVLAICFATASAFDPIGAGTGGVAAVGGGLLGKKSFANNSINTIATKDRKIL